MSTNTLSRQTSQKKIIMAYLKSVKSHPTADDVFSAVKAKLPQISRGTVYRNLNGFTEKGEAQGIKSRVAHYDGDTAVHAHFICQKCDNIFDLCNICEKCKITKRKKIKVGNVNNHQIHFYGICKNCRNK